MRRTYAYNSIIIGFLVALLVFVYTQSVVLAILALLGVSVVGFILIRLIENAISKGVSAATDAAARAIQNHKNKEEK